MPHMSSDSTSKTPHMGSGFFKAEDFPNYGPTGTAELANRILAEKGVVVSVGRRHNSVLGRLIYYADEDVGHSSSRGMQGLLINIHEYKVPDNAEGLLREMTERYEKAPWAYRNDELVERAKRLLENK